MVGVAIILAATLADDGAVPLPIRSETSCPTVAAVQAQLQSLTPRTPRPGPPEATGRSVALAEAADRGLVVTLRGPAEESLEERRLPLYGGCDERARAVALVIASWLTALPEAAPPTVGLTLPPPPTVTRAVAPLSTTGAIAVGLGAAGLASLAADGLAPGVMLEAAAGPRGAPWSLSLAGFLEGTHRTAVGAGEATWWRWGGAAGGAWQVARRGRLWLDLRGALLVSRLRIAGAGFSDNAGGSAWDVGGALGTRLGLALRRVQPWVGAWAVGWGGTQAVHVAGDVARGELPRWQGFFGLGATFGAGGETF